VSYILDALRKSEQQRQRGVAPSLLAVPPTFEADTQPAFLKYGLIATALIGAGVAIGWVHPWQQAQRLAATEPATVPLESPRPSLPAPLPVLPGTTGKSGQEAPVQKPWAAAEPAPAAEVAAIKQDLHLPANTPAQTASPPARTRKLPPKNPAAIPKETSAPAREMTAAPAQQKAVAPVEEKSADAAPADAAHEQRMISMAELPLAIQQEIPAMSIPLHTYSSTPGERIVGINDRLLQEGDYLAPGLKLEQIAPDGVVFSYKNYLFRRGL
jgi:general secretion pathway protein B